MTALPATSDFTSAANQTLAQTAYGAQRDFLAGLLGTDGTQATALATLGALGGKYSAKTAAYTVTASDRGLVIDATTGTWTLALLAAATAGAGFTLALVNSGTGVITIDPNGSETIDGGTTVSIAKGGAVILACNGSGWSTLHMPGPAQTSAVDPTAGRVLRSYTNGGSFGLGNLGILSSVSDLDAITIPTGWHQVITATTGTRPAGFTTSHFCVLEVVVFNSGVIHQSLRRNSPTGLTSGTYRRIYSSGAWSAWDSGVTRSNLLGTVSETGGVPTGGVIERDSNANGEYVRFADGTQICTITNLTAANCSTAQGAGFRSDDIEWTFPAAFAASPVVTPDFDNDDCWGSTGGITTTGCNVRALSFVTKASALNGRVKAVGRWF